jgi:hypothetical protein
MISPKSPQRLKRPDMRTQQQTALPLLHNTQKRIPPGTPDSGHGLGGHQKKQSIQNCLGKRMEMPHHQSMTCPLT